MFCCVIRHTFLCATNRFYTPKEPKSGKRPPNMQNPNYLHQLCKTKSLVEYTHKLSYRARAVPMHAVNKQPTFKQPKTTCLLQSRYLAAPRQLLTQWPCALPLPLQQLPRDSAAATALCAALPAPCPCQGPSSRRCSRQHAGSSRASPDQLGLQQHSKR